MIAAKEQPAAGSRQGDLPLSHHRAETAGHHLVRRVPLARADDSVKDVLTRLYGQVFDAVDSIYVVDEDRILRGLIRLRDLLTRPAASRLADVMNPRPPGVHPTKIRSGLPCSRQAQVHEAFEASPVRHRGRTGGLIRGLP